MALIVKIEVTNGRGVELLHGVQIRRTAPLRATPAAAADEVHDYEVTSWRPRADGTGHKLDHGVLRHRYGDGAQVLAAEALALIAHGGSTTTSEEAGSNGR